MFKFFMLLVSFNIVSACEIIDVLNDETEEGQNSEDYDDIVIVNTLGVSVVGDDSPMIDNSKTETSIETETSTESTAETNTEIQTMSEISSDADSDDVDEDDIVYGDDDADDNNDGLVENTPVCELHFNKICKLDLYRLIKRQNDVRESEDSDSEEIDAHENDDEMDMHESRQHQSHHSCTARKHKKIKMCHRSAGSRVGELTVEVSIMAALHHMIMHGDSMGSCDNLIKLEYPKSCCQMPVGKKKSCDGHYHKHRSNGKQHKHCRGRKHHRHKPHHHRSGCKHDAPKKHH